MSWFVKRVTMLADLIRDSAFGHCVRLITGKKYLQYPEEKDPEYWKRYVNQEKSGYAAYHGSTQPPENAGGVPELAHARSIRSRQGSDASDKSKSTLGDGVNEPSGIRVDPEKGRDYHVVDWDGPDDPQVSSNLSQTCR